VLYAEVRLCPNFGEVSAAKTLKNDDFVLHAAPEKAVFGRFDHFAVHRSS
jgi:hypothetical protein